LLAYISDESGRNEIYIVPYPAMNGKWQVSTGGADSPPIWSPTGKEMFFAEGGSLMKVDVNRIPNVTFSRPESVCPTPPLLFGLYDISRDGKRFLITVSAEESNQDLNQLNVIVGWFTELTQKLASIQK